MWTAEDLLQVCGLPVPKDASGSRSQPEAPSTTSVHLRPLLDSCDSESRAGRRSGTRTPDARARQRRRNDSPNHHSTQRSHRPAARNRACEHAKQAVRGPQQRATHGPALRVVRIHQASIGGSATHHRELPPEIPGVLNPRVHALCSDGTVNVSRVAGQEDPSVLVCDGLPVVEAEPCQPDRIVHSHGTAGRIGNHRLELGE